MSDEHVPIVDRLVQFRDTRAASVADRQREAQQIDAAARGTFIAGARVFDLDSGQHGVVIELPQLAGGSARLYGVRLDRGGIVTRSASRLIERPTPPTV